MSLQTDFQNHLRVVFFCLCGPCSLVSVWFWLCAQWTARLAVARWHFYLRNSNMIDALLKLSHLLSIIVWVGGMVFTHFFLRPAAAMLEPPLRVQLMHGVLERFFKVVLVLSSITVLSGLWMIGRVAKAAVQAGGSFQMPLSWTVMATLGLVMWAIFGHIRFALFRRMGRAVAAKDWPVASTALGRIRLWVGVNLVLGLLTVAVAVLLN